MAAIAKKEDLEKSIFVVDCAEREKLKGINMSCGIKDGRKKVGRLALMNGEKK